MTLIDDDFCLEPLHIDDAQSLSQLMVRNGKRFQKFLPITLSQNLNESSSKIYIRKKNEEISNRDGFTFAIKDKSTNSITGLVILKEIDWDKGNAEFAYCIGKIYEGRGWVTKSIKTFAHYAFSNLGLRKLHIIIHRSNQASISVAERAGFKWIKTLPEAFNSTEKGAMDMELYEKTK